MSLKIKVLSSSAIYLERVVALANRAEYIVPNSVMIYWLGCNVFTKFSFVAQYNNEVIGFLFAMPEDSTESVWLHQLFVEKKYQRKGVAYELVERLYSAIEQCSTIKRIRCAIKPDNIPSLTFAKQQEFDKSYRDDSLNMDIYVKHLIKIE